MSVLAHVPASMSRRAALKIAAAIGIGLAGALVSMPLMAATAPRTRRRRVSALAAGLRLTFPIQSSTIASYFNTVARPTDIATFPGPYHKYVPLVTAGQRSPIWYSLATTQAEIAAFDGITPVACYNPEHWAQTPPEDQSNLPAACSGFQTLAQQHGMQFLLVPDRQFDQDFMPQIAPTADLFIVQGQRIQSDPVRFGAEIGGVLASARAANPNLALFVQVGASSPGATADQMMTALDTVIDQVQGVSVWSMPTSLAILQAFVTQLRG